MSRFQIKLPLVLIDCKTTLEDAMYSNCPLKKFLDSDEAKYVAWPLIDKLLPNTNNFQTAVNEIKKIQNICKNCKNNGR